MWVKEAEEAWLACPCGYHLILLGDLNVNLHAPLEGIEKKNTEQMDSMALADMFPDSGERPVGDGCS